MTHVAPMPDSAGEFGAEKPDSLATCSKCRTAGTVMARTWESSCGGYEDCHYRCTQCGHTWWVDGIDS